MAVARLVALLRGINVGGKHKLPMADLRRIAGELGHRDPVTVIQSGNLLFTADGDELTAAKTLERALAEEFGFAVPVVVRRLDALRRDLAGCPFPDAQAERANLLHAGWSRAKWPKSLAADLAPYATAGERIAVAGSCLWIDFVGGVARSKVTSAVLDRLVGGTVTLRNSKTFAAILAADSA
ncbi:MAG: DUF1697 domain-containing protein [Planctomycetes bacterium]|nr:DUF1697 domain-containing protein [Planctomycetota bacterium]